MLAVAIVIAAIAILVILFHPWRKNPYAQDNAGSYNGRRKDPRGPKA